MKKNTNNLNQNNSTIKGEKETIEDLENDSLIITEEEKKEFGFLDSIEIELKE